MADKSHDVPPIPVPPGMSAQTPAAGTANPELPPADIVRSGPGRRWPDAESHQNPYAQPNPYGQPQTPVQPNPYASQPAMYSAPHPYGQQAPYAQPNAYTQPHPYGSAQPGAYVPAAMYDPYAPRPARGLSTASMVLGLIGLVFSFFGSGFLLVLAAVITGHMGLRSQPAARSFAMVGVITGYVGLGFSFLWGIFWAFIFMGAFSY